MAVLATDRSQLIQRGRVLEYFTVAYNTAEGLISIIAGLIAGSVSLIGFGLDSMIPTNPGVKKLSESLCGLSVGASSLVRHETPSRSIPGILIAALSVVVMPLLARAKRRVAEGIGSNAMKADSRQTDFCTYLSAILLGGLLLNALLGWGGLIQWRDS